MADGKINIKQAIVVEGKYDKIKLSSIFNAVIIVLNGFGIYKDKEKLELLRYYAANTGIIILTDSDSAGFRIRNYLKGAIKGNIKNVYIPDIFGKEKRKAAPSAEGKLGVEGIEKSLIIDSFKKANVIFEGEANSGNITKTDLFELGLSGSTNSSQLRSGLLKYLDLPQLLTTNSMLEVLNTMMSAQELAHTVKTIREQ